MRVEIKGLEMSTSSEFKAAVLLALIGSGCASTWSSAPPVTEVIEPVIVRAHTREDAERIAALRSEIEPKVRALLGSRRRGPEIWLLDQPTPGRHDAVVRAGKVWLSPACKHDEDLALAHAMAHWHFRGSWDRLPAIVREGLADLVAAAVLPRWRLAIPHRHKLCLEDSGPADLEGWMRLCATDPLILDDERQGPGLQAIGYAIAARIGFDGLWDACREAEAGGLEEFPLPRLLEQAGIDPVGRDGSRGAISVTLPLASRRSLAAPTKPDAGG